jgi:phenylacetate-CoA ligase
MSVRSLIAGKFILSAADLVTGNSVKKTLDFLNESQWWTAEELKAYQNDRLRVLIRHAFENVPFYREMFKKMGLDPHDIRKTEDLARIPILSKNIVRENIKNGKMIAGNIPDRRMIRSASSGSTGEPLQYFVTKYSYSFNIAANLRGWGWMGYKLGDRYIKLSQNPRKTGKRIQDYFNNCFYLFFQNLSDGNFKAVSEQLTHYSPDYLRGYPDVLFLWARYMKLRKMVVPRIKALNTTGNVLYPEMRKMIEETFQTPVFDSYACEGGANVFECPTHLGYHSSMEYAISEILPRAAEWPDSKQKRIGILVTTDLHNYAVPLIRYNTQDVLEISDGECACGRKLLPIRGIQGRISDVLVTPKNQYLIVHNFTGFFEWIPSVEQFQIRQVSSEKLRFLLKVNSVYSQRIEKEILRYWKHYTGYCMEIEILLVDEIPLTDSGKRRFLIRECEIAA